MIRKPPTDAQHPLGAPALHDDALLELLLDKAPLTDQQTALFVEYAEQLKAGKIARLPKSVRDHACHVAKAAGLLERTVLKKRPTGGLIGFGDPYSTVPGELPKEVAKQLGKIPAPIKRSA